MKINSQPPRNLLLLLALFSLAIPSSAVTSPQINLDNSRVEMAIKPGKSKRVRIKITNSAEMPARVKAYMQDIRILPDGSPDFPEPGSTPWSLKEIVSSIPASFMLAGRSNRGIGFTVSVPEGAKGAYYGAVMFEEEPSKTKKQASGSHITINFRLACLVLITIKGTELVQAKLKELKAWHENGRVKATISIANEGNVLIRPQGQVQLFKGPAALLSEKLNVKKFVLMPGDTREYTVDWPDANIPPGAYEVISELDYGGKEILGGKTTLSLE